MPTRNTRPLVIAAFACAILFAAKILSAADAEPGLVQDPPQQGPRVKTERGYMIPYRTKIPGTSLIFEMMPIPGGKFLLGSPDSEAGRKSDEGPQVEVVVPPFWMAKTEVTWGEYKAFMALNEDFRDLHRREIRLVTDDRKSMAVTAPSEPYDLTFPFAKGNDPRLPAVTMSQFAAKQYTKWLSLLTGQSYRLPTEAEWEYACRAGTTTAWSSGADSAQLGDCAWLASNSDDSPHFVGLKKANPWGLHDMHGNVAEWCLDEYVAGRYFVLKSGVAAADAVAWPTKLYPRVIRGGSWDSNPSGCRSAVRLQSDDKEWNNQDPDNPQSPWWFSSEPAQCVGFRIMRPLAPFTPGEKQRSWEPGLPSIAEAVDQLIRNGRSFEGVVDAGLPAAVEKVRSQRPALRKER